MNIVYVCCFFSFKFYKVSKEICPFRQKSLFGLGKKELQLGKHVQNRFYHEVDNMFFIQMIRKVF